MIVLKKAIRVIVGLLGVAGFIVSVLTWIRQNKTDKIFTDRYKRLTETDLKIMQYVKFN